MCGINGIIHFNGKNVDVKRISSMNTIIKHRGPDGDGYFIDKNVGLGHVRLSIIDLTDAASQPFIIDEGDYVLVFNGEIYNYVELRKELEAEGIVFTSSSDTEVLLRMYKKHGVACLDYFNGMFAFAIYDKKQGKVFLARDRIGIKPLYYAQTTAGFYFSSEIKSLVKTGLVKPVVDNDGVLDYLHFQFPLGEKTLFAGIKQLLPANYLLLDVHKGTFVMHEYWRLNFMVQKKEPVALLKEELLTILQDSVRLRLRSDVPVGAHLSGGLDSSSVTMLASGMTKNKIKSFTGGFKDKEGYDETAYARLVAKTYGTEYHEVIPTFEDFKNTIHKIIYFLDYPVVGPGVFPQYMVCQLAHDTDVKVVLGGQGGDELFGGYARYIIAYLEQCLKGAIYESQETSDFIVTLQSIIPNLSLLREYTPMLKRFWSQNLFEPMDQRYYDLLSRMTDVDKIVNFKTDYDPKDAFMKIFHDVDAKSYIDKMLHFDIKTMLLGLLHVEDRTSMAWSLESRVPLLDHRVVEFSATIPPKTKFHDGKTKHLLKESFRGSLIDEVIDRKDKMGFPVPLYEWFEEELKEWLLDILASEETRIYSIIKKEYVLEKIRSDQRFSREVWGLLCLELWLREYF